MLLHQGEQTASMNEDVRRNQVSPLHAMRPTNDCLLAFIAPTTVHPAQFPVMQTNSNFSLAYR